MSLPAFLMIDSALCNILRLTPNVNHEFGTSPGTFGTIATNVVCVLDREQSINKRFFGGSDVSLQGVTYVGTYKLLTLATTDILVGDKVTVAGVDYDVVDVISFSTHKEVILNKST